jgi:hypothetical protein
MELSLTISEPNLKLSFEVNASAELMVDQENLFD